MTCYYCGTSEQLRPYGPGGAPLCFDCMKADPEREVKATQAFDALVEAALAVSPNRTVIVDGKGIK